MGNWTRVQITGTCAPGDVGALRNMLAADFSDDEWTCLCNGGLCGLPNWAGETIKAVGNLGERDYGAQDVMAALERYAVIAPSLAVKVHIGADYEEAECIGTVTLADQKASFGPAEADSIPEISLEQMQANLFGLM